MKSFKKALGKIATTAVFIAAMHGTPTMAQSTKVDSAEMSKPSIEMTLDAKADMALKTNGYDLGSRTEAYIGAGLTLGKTKIKYDGLHMIDDLDYSTYFGSNVISVTEKGAGTEICSVLTTTKAGIVDVQYGVLNKTILQKLGTDFGFVRFTLNQKKANVTFLAGKDLGKGFSGYVWSTTTLPYEGKLKNLTWVELGKKLGGHVSGYIRGEVTDAKLGQGVMLLGLYLNK